MGRTSRCKSAGLEARRRAMGKELPRPAHATAGPTAVAARRSTQSLYIYIRRCAWIFCSGRSPPPPCTRKRKCGARHDTVNGRLRSVRNVRLFAALSFLFSAFYSKNKYIYISRAMELLRELLHVCKDASAELAHTLAPVRSRQQAPFSLDKYDTAFPAV